MGHTLNKIIGAMTNKIALDRILSLQRGAQGT